MTTEISTLTEFIEWAEQFSDGHYLFRGVSKETYKIEASASRRLRNGDRKNPEKLLEINKEMINDARLQGHGQKNGGPLSDLELLAELQHYGAATCLIDFTYSAQVALWFACGKRSKCDVNGKVFAVRSDDPVRFKKVTAESLQKDLGCFFKRHEHKGYPSYQWPPKQQNNRIIAQQSVFLFGGAEIEPDAECVILKSSKEAILASLKKSSGINEARMFPDFDGFARLRTQDRLYKPDVQGCLQRGNEALQAGRLDDAIANYKKVISLKPANLTLANAYFHRGLAYADKQKYDLAREDYDKAIENNPKFAYAYQNRALVYIIQGQFNRAITDYSKLIELNPDSPFAYSQRADAYENEGQIKRAIEDYDKVIKLMPDEAKPDFYYRRGIAWLHLKNWKKAKADLVAAQNGGVDIINRFSQYPLTANLEGAIGGKLPPDIAAMLMPA